MRDSARRRRGLDLVVLLETLQSVPEPHAATQEDRDHHDVHVVDEPGGKEVADDGGTSADAHVPAVRRLAGRLEGLGGRRVEEVERRAALHFDRRARVVSEDEDGCVERRVGPHAPFQSGSSSQPGWPNFPAPMISAPIPRSNRWRKTSSTPPLPPDWPIISRPQRALNIHSCSRCPAWPKCAVLVWPSPVPKPSSEMEKCCT